MKYSRTAGEVMYKLYSHNDLDGVGCGIIIKLALGEEGQVYYNSVGGLDYKVEKFFSEKDHKDTKLYITDLSINEDNTKRVDDFVKQGGQAQLIDHHKTALHFNEYEWATVTVQYDDGRQTCATSLLYEYFVEQKKLSPKRSIEQFIELVRQYDTWEWDENNNVKAKQLNDLFYMFSIEEFEEMILQRLKTADDFEFDELEAKLLSMEEAKIERYIKRKKRELIQASIDKHIVGVVHAESYHSELGNELGKEYPHLDYIAILNTGGRKVSFRTIHNHIDVSAVAGTYGGGGHAKASGCTMNEEAFRKFVVELFTEESLKIDAPKNKFNQKENSHGTIYEGRSGDIYRIYQKQEQWKIEKNHQENATVFKDFQSAVNAIKIADFAWLAKDDVYDNYMKKNK